MPTKQGSVALLDDPVMQKMLRDGQQIGKAMYGPHRCLAILVLLP